MGGSPVPCRFLPDPLNFEAKRDAPRVARLARAAAGALALMLAAAVASAQVLTIDTSGKGNGAGNGPVDRQFQQVTPTKVDLPKTPLDEKTRLELVRSLQQEQGFAMRPFPRGHKGLTLEANGKLTPAGQPYLDMVVSEGLSAKPGSRLVITNVKFDHNKMIFDLNDGPDARHRLLRHVQIGVGPQMGDPDVDPTLLNDAGDPIGTRLTLEFKNDVPALTPAQVKALLAPLISFDVKTPIQAFTDTLPPALKDAILSHKVWVGMSTDMVLYAKGQPLTKSREMDGQTPFEEWIYGTPPAEVDFVRINGNRVIRVEVAKEGEPLAIFTKDVVSGMMRSDGSPVMTAQANTRTVREGDVEVDPDKQAPAAPPSLRAPGESLPQDTDKNSAGVMRPVQPPRPHTDNDQLGVDPDEQQSAPAAKPAQQGTSPSAPANGQSAPTNAAQPSASRASASQPSASQGQPAAAGAQPSTPAQHAGTSGTAAPPPAGAPSN
jgi:hypothetical protein